MSQSGRQIGFSFVVLAAIALPALFVKKEVAAGFVAGFVIMGFVLSLLFKEFAIDLVVLIGGLGLALNFFLDFSKSEDPLDLVIGFLGVLSILAIGGSVAIQEAMEGKLKNAFVAEYYDSEARSLDPAIRERFGLVRYTDPVSSFSGRDLEFER